MRSPLSSASHRHRADLIALGLAALWLIGWRISLGSSWGLFPSANPAGRTDSGILYNAGDTWSYLSWVQQYSYGNGLAGLLYTTEPHRALLWMFPLWLVGKVASLTGLPVVGVYNVCGFLGALGAVYLFRRAVAAFRLPVAAGETATIALVLGSGGSWFWHLFHKLHLAPPVDGGDLLFFDFFPATAFLAYAYHAIGLVLLTGLWWTATETETRLVSTTRSWPWLAALAGLAVLLGFSRPYEPLAFLGAWTLKTLWHGLKRHDEPRVSKASFRVLIVLSLTLLPGIGWTLWISHQPVWSTFAHASLALGLPRSAWLWTLAGWGGLVGLGLPCAWKADHRLAALPVAATTLLVLILFGLGGANTKLASGLMLGPIILSGWGCLHLWTLLSACPKFARITLVCLCAGALIGAPTWYLIEKSIQLQGPSLIDQDLCDLAHRLPITPGHPPAVVLTDGDTGTILPGLVGARVWVGHWSLSPHYKDKIARLQAAGLDPSHPPADHIAAQVALTAILADAHFDYALIDLRTPAVIATLKSMHWETLATTSRWALLRPSPSSP